MIIVGVKEDSATDRPQLGWRLRPGDARPQSLEQRCRAMDPYVPIEIAWATGYGPAAHGLDFTGYDASMGCGSSLLLRLPECRRAKPPSADYRHDHASECDHEQQREPALKDKRT